jgi:hypothetical protein
VLPKNVEGTRAKLERLVELGIHIAADTGSFASEQESAPQPAPLPQASPVEVVNETESWWDGASGPVRDLVHEPALSGDPTRHFPGAKRHRPDCAASTPPAAPALRTRVGLALPRFGSGSR